MIVEEEVEKSYTKLIQFQLCVGMCIQTEVLCNSQQKVKKFSVGEMAELLEHET